MDLQNLDDSLDDPERCQRFSDSLALLHEALRKADPRFLLISDPAFLDEFIASVQDLWVSSAAEGSKLTVPPCPPQRANAFVVTTQVNYCASAFPTVPESHDDSAALSILGSVLRNGYLHTEIREKGGAYGGGATHDSANGVFRFYSYRDPNINETFKVFEHSIAWALESSLTEEMLEEAVLGIIAGIDAPASPAGEIRQAFHHGLSGRSADYRQRLRQSFFNVGVSDLERVAETYLAGDPSLALVTSENRLAEISDEFVLTRIT